MSNGRERSNNSEEPVRVFFKLDRLPNSLPEHKKGIIKSGLNDFWHSLQIAIETLTASETDAVTIGAIEVLPSEYAAYSEIMISEILSLVGTRTDICVQQIPFLNVEADHSVVAYSSYPPHVERYPEWNTQQREYDERQRKHKIVRKVLDVISPKSPAKFPIGLIVANTVSPTPEGKHRITFKLQRVSKSQPPTLLYKEASSSF